MKVTSKIGNAALLIKHESISSHIPQTQPFTHANLKRMLHTFPVVYIKPNDSAQGKGIFRVDVHPDDSYLLRSRDIDDRWHHKDFDELWNHVNRIKRPRYYIVQQGVSSVTKHGSLFDIRVHMTRVNKKWIIAGMVGRMAPPDGIVTNYFLEGPTTYVSNLLTGYLHLSSTEAERKIQEIKTLSLTTTKIMSSAYPKWSEFGLDIGVDEEQKLWIYEVNITPGASVFQKLNYPSYLRIMQLRKQAK